MLLEHFCLCVINHHGILGFINAVIKLMGRGNILLIANNVISRLSQLFTKINCVILYSRVVYTVGLQGRPKVGVQFSMHAVLTENILCSSKIKQFLSKMQSAFLKFKFTYTTTINPFSGSL